MIQFTVSNEFQPIDHKKEYEVVVLGGGGANGSPTIEAAPAMPERGEALDNPEAAAELAALIDSAPQSRRTILIERLCHLVISDRGGPASGIFSWINDDCHVTWEK